MTFSELGLSQKVLAAVEAAGYTQPTEIQAQAIPFALAGRDVLGIAQTGTGKTAAFTLPILTRFEKGRTRARMPRSLILEPTRELAAQVADALETYGAKHKLNVALLIGGVSFADQNRKLDRGADIVIATPGRLLDHQERGKLMLNAVEILVVDEADRMLDMGFIPDIERIFKLTPFTRQTLFFSATMPPEIQRLTDAFLHTPEQIEVAPPSSIVATIEQKLVRAPAEPMAKRDAFRKLLRSLEIATALVFCNRKRDVKVLQRSLAKHGFNVGEIHGDMDQHARMDTLERFRSGTLKYLVASDVAARGLDIPKVSHVFNFDVPYHAEDYVHRIGRTGRAGRRGEAYMLVSKAEHKALAAIEGLIGKKIDWLDGAHDAAQGEARPARQAAAAPPAEEETTAARPRRRSSRGNGAGNGHGRAHERDSAATRAPAKARQSAGNGHGRAHERESAAKRAPAMARQSPERGETVAFAETADVPAFLRRSFTPAS
jgi:superfamily II DNA/RNA helicase